MKKFISIILTLILLVGVTACNPSASSTPDGTQSPNGTATPNATNSPTQTPVATVKPDKVTEVDGFTVSEKKYDYKGSHVMILTVQNTSDKAYDVTITASFNNENGDTIKSITQNFKGFCSNWTNYAIFEPEITFDSFSFELTATEYTGVEYIKCVKLFGGDGFDFSVKAKNTPGRELYRFHKLDKSRLDEASAIDMTRVIWVDCDELLDFEVRTAIFDENSELYHVVDVQKCVFKGWGTHDKTLWGNEASDPFAADIMEVENGMNVKLDVKADIEKLINGYAINSYLYAVIHVEES